MSSQNNNPDMMSNMPGKKKKHEEQMDEEMKSPERKQTHHKQVRSSEKKKKRKQSGSNSSAVKDESMKGAGEDEEMEEDSDDDDDDEEEYDDEDEESIKGFIVDDDEALEELMEQDDGNEHPEQEKVRKKKKKVRERKLDEEDFELLQENIGMKVQKRKRLQKHSEREKDQDIPDQAQKSADQKQLLSQELLQKDEDEELIDTKQRRKFMPQNKQPRSQYFDNQNEQFIDQDKAMTAKQIFEDHHNLAQRVQSHKRARDEEMMRAESKDNLEEFFDGDEIDDQFATKQDKVIAETDIPERLQLKIAERLQSNFKGEFDDDVRREVEFIFNRLVDITKREDLLQYEEQVKKKIKNVINYLRRDYLDVPMIAKYRRFDYMKELDESDVWLIYNLDLEYGKFYQQRQQMLNFIFKISQIDHSLQIYADDIEKTRNLQELQNYSALISFLKQYYFEELQALPEEQKKKLPFKTDQVAMLKKHQYDIFAKEIFLDPVHFIENLVNNEFIHKPPKNVEAIDNIIRQYNADQEKDLVLVLHQNIKFASIQLSVQPYLRFLMKKHMYNTGYLSTEPTEQGKKVLDVFHPSYGIKHIKEELLLKFQDDDRFLDIIQNEKRELITVEISISKDSLNQFFVNLQSKYEPADYPDHARKIYLEMLRMLLEDHLIPDIRNEIKDELTETAENYVIKRCQDQYRNILMTGPFSCEDITRRGGEEKVFTKGKNKSESENIIQDRPRCTVMGVILQQINQNTSIVTVAIVDKFGELVNHKDFQHLMPLRRLPPKDNPPANDEEEQRLKKSKMSYTEELKEHEHDKDQIKDLIQKYQVDLIVVGANRLEARLIKKVLSEIAENLKNYGPREEDEHKKGSKKRQTDQPDDVKKEAFVIWGSLEVPKLFANCHQSQKLLKNSHPILKQAVSLARFEQDPMIEILNLWSFVPSDNQALQLNLHPMQKLINQAKLADSLEEINIQSVNAIGVDLNLVIDHDHMNVLLSFISGIGPRKSRKFIQNLKQYGKKIVTRGEIYQNSFLQRFCHLSAIAFLKIRIPPDEFEDKLKNDILDQTRIHPESYMVAHKVTKDVIYEGKDVDDFHSYQAVKEVIKNPDKLKQLDLVSYKQELENSQQTNMIILLDYIIEELRCPFKDPRSYRTPTKLMINNTQLFYMLIDESERTFKRGIIVTATVVRVVEDKVFCKLDNGLDGLVMKADLEKTDKNLQYIIQPGHVLTGRIHEIKDKEEQRFGVALNCKLKDLQSHRNYVGKVQVPEEDLINSAFQIDNKIQQQGRYQSRRINHPKFKNISSTKAIAELQDKEVGEFTFRPSSRGPDHITLTWKFYTNNIVHIDIIEHEKALGATIGSKLAISEEVFDNLQEIVERYILPCNRLLREACTNAKFKQCDTVEELDKVLQEEKKGDSNRIPYKLTILPQYPQHIVIGYLPKTQLIKEYIKIKPRGYIFHEKQHNPITNLINWFKENYKSKDYQKQQRRQRSPRAKAQADPVQLGGNQRLQQNDDRGQWNEISNEWKRPSGGNSIHSAHEENQQDYQTPYAKTDAIRNSEHGGITRGGNQGGYSDHYQNNKMQDSNEPRGRGGNKSCFNCGEMGHMSRECPNKDQRKPMGRGRGRGNDNDRAPYRKPDNEGEHKWDNEEPSNANAWGAGNQGANSPSNAQATWANDTAGAPKSPKGWGGNENPTVGGDQPTQGGWGSKTPQRTDNFNGGGWGDNNNNDNAWGAGGDNNNDRRSSPARSQRSQEESGRGRGRGRGRGGDQQNRGPGGPRSCFKCNQEGHMARECPNADQRPERGRGGGGGPRSCFKCNQEGHMARECPNADQRQDRGPGGDRGRGRGRGRGGGPNVCFKCNQEGHFARECPNEQANNDGERPYKRQRRDDGGSIRRNEGGEDWNNGGGNDNWKSGGGDNNWNNNQNENNGWENQKSNDNPGNQWGNPGGWEGQNQQDQEKKDKRSSHEEGGANWGNPDSNNQGGGW